jgi:acetyl esterase/lipase
MTKPIPALLLVCVLAVLCATFPGCSQKASTPPAEEAAAPSAALEAEAAASAAAKEDPDGPPPMPKGYASTQEAMVAVLSGAVKSIDMTMPAPAGVKEIMDIEYGNAGGIALKLDLALPENATKPVPGLIFMVGGGWKDCDRESYYYYTRNYAKDGYAAATITYRTMDQAIFPGCVSDAKCAVRWMRANAAQYNIDPDHIAVIGGSAGGHLSMMVGYSSDVPELEGDGGHAGVSSAVQAVVNFYGPCDLTTEQARTNDGVNTFLGASYDDDPGVYDMASPLHHLNAGDPPTLIFHGSVDDLVPLAQSERLAETLKSFGIDYVYEPFEGWPHTMDLAQPVNDRCRWFMSRFFEKHLKAKS